jgi:Mrp family chromosome partitioning ATPase
LLSSAAIITLLEAVRGPAIEDPEETDPDPEPAEVEAPLTPTDWTGNSDLPASGVEKSVWRATLLNEGAAELSGHLRELLDTIVVMPEQRGKVVLVTSGETGVGKSAVARSLNSLAVERGMLSVLIEILPEQFLLRARQGRIDEGIPDRVRPLRTDARSVNLLLETSHTVAVEAFPGDVRAEFDLIVIDAPALTEQSDVAALLAHADFTILVARDGATNPGAIDRAKAALSGFGNSLIGIVINKTDEKVDSRMATAG